ncbi:hypothetical protein M0811_07752 [Anaeramoeba ignava]|uniref:Uncharacterized protein n=1 Tax=Anaeramoeba ignava TaxID=1746090 RepID=A0A9Q0LLK4_ANAIG|nr:hypothetical protein M0811_07752 [Anaeramoeba ignava]
MNLEIFFIILIIESCFNSGISPTCHYDSIGNAPQPGDCLGPIERVKLKRQEIFRLNSNCDVNQISYHPDGDQLRIKCGHCEPGTSGTDGNGACKLNQYCSDLAICEDIVNHPFWGSKCPYETGGPTKNNWCGTGLRCIQHKCLVCENGVVDPTDGKICVNHQWTYSKWTAIYLDPVGFIMFLSAILTSFVLLSKYIFIPIYNSCKHRIKKKAKKSQKIEEMFENNSENDSENDSEQNQKSKSFSKEKYFKNPNFDSNSNSNSNSKYHSQKESNSEHQIELKSLESNSNEERFEKINESRNRTNLDSKNQIDNNFESNLTEQSTFSGGLNINQEFSDSSTRSVNSVLSINSNTGLMKDMNLRNHSENQKRRKRRLKIVKEEKKETEESDSY